MASSQNGWPVVGQSAVIDRAVHGVEFPNGWLKGDVDVVFTHLIDRLHAEVETIDKGGCWGWFVKPIEGSTTISNHASGTAIDYNAPAHPMGVRNTYGAADRARIRGILADLSGVVRWGGDYTGRPDDMHFEINKGPAAVKAVADRIRAQEDDMTKAELLDVLRSDAGQAIFTEHLLAALNDTGVTKRHQAIQHGMEIGRTSITQGGALATLLTRSADADLDEAEIIAGVLAGLNPATIAAAIPQNIAAQVADELRARLQA